jgi:hypothetical protein
MKNTKTMLFFLILITLFVLTSCLSITNQVTTSTPIPSISHTVNDLVGIEPIWVAEKVYIHWNDQDATLDSSTGKTCFLGNLGERHKYYDNLICLESQSGNLLWDNYSGIHGEIAVTSDGIFVTYIGSASVRKYDFQNGNFVWKNSKLGGGMGSSYLYFQDGQIEVVFIHERTVILSADGKVVRTIKGESVFVSQRDEIVIDLDGLQSNKANTDDVLWKYEDTRINSAPLFTDDKIFVLKDFSKTEYALDRNIGALLWEIPKILGNFAYSSNKQVVYALREDGELLAIDENSGKESVIAKFSPAPFLYSDGVDDAGYQLSYDEKEHILVVYTGDSRQLFAFREN